MNNKNGTQYAENAIQAIETLHKEYLDMVEKVEMLEKEKKEGYKIPSDCMMISKVKLEEIWGLFEQAEDEADYAYRACEEASSNADNTRYYARDGRSLVSELIDEIDEKQREDKSSTDEA